jgi:hypothetical protein
MKTSTCSLPPQPSSLCALSAPRQTTPQPEVRLRTQCKVEYTIQASVRNRMGGASDGDEEREVVILSIFVPRCSLNPTQVRIIEV